MESSLSFPHVNRNKQFRRRHEGRKCFEAQVGVGGEGDKTQAFSTPLPHRTEATWMRLCCFVKLMRLGSPN